MKISYKHLFWLISLGLVVINVFIFIQSVKLGQRINFYESESGSLHKKNVRLENKIYSLDSLQYAASLAAELNFVKDAEPVFLEDLKYALGK